MYLISALIATLLTYVVIRPRFLTIDEIYSVIPGWHTTIFPPAITWTIITFIILIVAILVYSILRFAVKVVSSCWVSKFCFNLITKTFLLSSLFFFLYLVRYHSSYEKNFHPYVSFNFGCSYWLGLLLARSTLWICSCRAAYCHGGARHDSNQTIY